MKYKFGELLGTLRKHRWSTSGPAVQNPAIINDSAGDAFAKDSSPGGGRHGGVVGGPGAGIRGEEGEGNMRERKVGETRIISLTLDVAFFSMGLSLFRVDFRHS